MTQNTLAEERDRAWGPVPRETAGPLQLVPVPRSAVVLSAVAFGAAAVASAATLVWRGAFPDPTPSLLGNRVLAEGRGWSAATLLVALPLGLVALRAACHGSLRGRLVWLGVLAYLVYMYLECAVSPPFTALYLLYVTAFACAIPALILGVTSVPIATLPAVFGAGPNRAGAGVPRRTVAIFSFVVAALLALVWLSAIARKTYAGAFGWPAGEEAVSHVVHALDLGLQVPLGIATGVLLVRRRPAGLLVAALMLVNAVCMGAALTGMVVAAAIDAGTSLAAAAPFALFWALSVALAVAFFRAGLGLPLVAAVPGASST